MQFLLYNVFFVIAYTVNSDISYNTKNSIVYKRIVMKIKVN